MKWLASCHLLGFAQKDWFVEHRFDRAVHELMVFGETQNRVRQVLILTAVNPKNQ